MNSSDLIKLITTLSQNKEFMAQLTELCKVPCTIRGLKISAQVENRTFNFELDELTTGVKQDK